MRREELAELAGISVDYVVRLEQGRATTPSVQVLAALARALQLSASERDHLHRLAGFAPPPDGEISDHLPPGLQRVLTRLGDVAAAVFAADWQAIWWNRGWTALYGDPSSAPPAERNYARDVFPTDDAGPRMCPWPVESADPAAVEAAVVSDLRRATGRFPESRRLAALVELLLEGNGRFAELWASGEVGAHREAHKVVHHPTVGPIALDCDVLGDGAGELKIVVLTAVMGSDDDTRLRLAQLSGSPEPART